MARIIAILPKGPIPRKGRYGRVEWQDWYQTVVKAVRLFHGSPGSHIFVSSAFKADGESESEWYEWALRRLEVMRSHYTCRMRGQGTIEHLRLAYEYAVVAGMPLTVVSTLTHCPRVAYLLWKEKIKAELVVSWRGLPRPREAVTDLILTFLFPLIDLTGMRGWFNERVEKRRLAGKL